MANILAPNAQQSGNLFARMISPLSCVIPEVERLVLSNQYPRMSEEHRKG
jgi:hypothetical protein